MTHTAIMAFIYWIKNIFLKIHIKVGTNMKCRLKPVTNMQFRQMQCLFWPDPKLLSGENGKRVSAIRKQYTLSLPFSLDLCLLESLLKPYNWCIWFL